MLRFEIWAETVCIKLNDDTYRVSTSYKLNLMSYCKYSKHAIMIQAICPALPYFPKEPYLPPIASALPYRRPRIRFSCPAGQRSIPPTSKSSLQYSTVQYSTVQYITIQYSTVQYSTVQYSTVQSRAEKSQKWEGKTCGHITNKNKNKIDNSSKCLQKNDI